MVVGWVGEIIGVFKMNKVLLQNVIAGRRGPLGRRLGGEREPSTTAVDRRSDKWATRTSADVSVPRLRCDVPPGFP